MTYNFCTFFNKKYSYQALALYNSIEKFCPDFKLWVLCMDEATYDFFKKINITNIELIKIEEVEDDEIRAVKNQDFRNYYGTIKPSFILYILKNNTEIDSLLYLDTDIFFFSSPAPIYNMLENTNYNIVVFGHKFPEEEKYLEKRNGIFNAGAVMFKRNEIGLACLMDWRQKCIQLCENIHPGSGHYGDQQYMDSWPQAFPGVCIFKGKGANLGPWNVRQYTIRRADDSIYIDDDILIFYHFSSLRIHSPKRFLLFDYAYSASISRRVRKIIYHPYTRELQLVITKLNEIHPSFVPGYDPQLPFLKNLKSHLKYNVVKLHIRLKKKSPLYSKVFYKYLKKRNDISK